MNSKYRKQKQSGAALAISLIILLVLTLLVVSGTQDVVMQERMTSAIRDTNISLAVAEAGLNDAAAVIDALADKSEFDSTGAGDGFYSVDNGPPNVLAYSVWSNSANVSTATTSVSGLTADYIIIDLGIVVISEEDMTGINMMGYGQTTGGGEVNLFQIVSRATGNSGNAERIVMSYYGKRF